MTKRNIFINVYMCKLFRFTKENKLFFTFVNISNIRNMKDRLVQLLEREQITPSRFADIIGVQRSSVSHIVSGRNNPSYDFLQKTLNAFPGLRAEWLLMGKGPMFERPETGFTGTLFDTVSSPESRKTARKEEVQGSEIHDREVAQPDTHGREQNRRVDIRGEQPGISKTEPGTSKAETGRPRSETGPSRRKVIQVVILYDDRTFNVFESSGPA